MPKHKRLNQIISKKIGVGYNLRDGGADFKNNRISLKIKQQMKDYRDNTQFLEVQNTYFLRKKTSY